MMLMRNGIATSPEERKIIGILQPSYLPWLGFIEQVYKSDIFVLYDDVQFEKGSWRNRNRIKTATGAQWLTVPVLSKDSGHQHINEIKIDNSSSWRKKHLQSIRQNYSKAPFFAEFAPPLLTLINKPYTRLVELNQEILQWLLQVLGINTRIVLSSSLAIGGNSSQRLIDIIRHFSGNVFYEGAAGKNYIDINDFLKEGIVVRYQEYQHPEYRQLYPPFISHLSIIDLLFNCGPDSLSILLGT